MKRSFTLSLLLLSMLLMSGCCKDEPVIIVPEPDAAPPSISGTISTNGGVPLMDVTITVSLNGKTYTATTDSKGQYSVEVSDEGTYTVKAEKEGYTSKTDKVITVSNVVSVWNAILPKTVVISNLISKEGETVVEVPIPPLVPTSAGEDSLTMKFSTQSVSKDDSLIIEVEYRESALDWTKASQMMSLLVVHYRLASGNPLLKEIDITVEVPVEANQVLLNRSEVAYKFENEEIKIHTRDTGKLVLNYEVDITEDLSRTEEIQFAQSVWDNFHGAGPIHILNPEYTLKTGGTIQGNHPLLNSLAASYTGVPNLSSVLKEYTLDLTLPVGGKLVLEGTQGIHKYDFKVADGLLMNSTVLVYESAYITAKTYNRQHSGGSN